jgi:hypothetical protein
MILGRNHRFRAKAVDGMEISLSWHPHVPGSAARW